MTAFGNKEGKGLLAVSSFCDRPEREIFCRLAEHVPVSLICDPDNPGQTQLRQAGVETAHFSKANPAAASLEQMISERCRQGSFSSVYAPRTETLTAAIRALRDSDIQLVGYRGTTGHLSIMDVGPRLAYTNPRVDRIICVSDAVARYLETKGIHKDKLVKIHKGHDPEWYQPAERSDLYALGIPADAFIIGFAGRTRRIKGVRFLIKALQRLPEDINAHLIIAGKIDDLLVKAMLKIPAVCQKVHSTGFREDAPKLMGACDAFVMPSLKREGLPRALIEAMSQCVPCVATRVGGIPELIEDGKSGVLVPPRSSSAICAALESLAADRQKAREIGAQARERIETDFHIDTTVQEMLNVFSHP